MIRQLDSRVSVAPQIAPGDLAEAVRAGFVAVVNNRPDGEEPGQPAGATIAEAARAVGLAYHEVPVGHAGLSREQIDEMARLLEQADGPVLAYCRSGTRSTTLWALARATLGDSPDRLVAAAAAAGYDLERMRPTLAALAAAEL